MLRVNPDTRTGILSYAPGSVIVLFRVLCVVVYVGIPVWCSAGGILHVFPPMHQGEMFAVARPAILHSSSLITVSERSLEHRFEQTFYNNNDFPVKGVYLLGFERNRSPRNIQVRIDGIPHPFATLSAEKFFPILRKICLEMSDPSLLELTGRKVLMIRPVSLGVRQHKSVKVQWQYPLSGDEHSLQIKGSLAGERYSLGPVNDHQVRVRFKMSRPVRTIFSPTHPISVLRESADRCLVHVHEKQTRVSQDFRLVATFSSDPVDLLLLTDKEREASTGRFMVLLAPPILDAPSPPVPKDVVFVMDASGSLGESNLEMVRRAVIFCLGKLLPKDRFNVLAVGTRVKRMADTLKSATTAHLEKAADFVSQVKNEGGTDLYNGLITALEQFSSRKRHGIVVMVSDGRATVAVTSPRRIVEDTIRSNRFQARIFALAIGDDPDMALLDKLSAATKGSFVRHKAGQSFESTVNRFYALISPPKVSEIQVNLHGISTSQVLPKHIPDLFGMQSTAILGQYEAHEDIRANLEVRAIVNGQKTSLEKRVRFPAQNGTHPYVTRLWVMRRLAVLLERVWLKGPQLAVRNRVVDLTRRFGFQSPAFATPRPTVGLVTRRTQHDLGTFLWRLKNSNLASSLTSPSVRVRNGKVFRRERDRWVDSQFREILPIKKARFLSDAYFDLVKENPSLGPYLSLGPLVTVVQGRRAVAVEERSPRSKNGSL